MALFGKPRVGDATTVVVESTDLQYRITRGGQVSRWGSRPMPEGLVEEGHITDNAATGRVLDGLFREEGLERNKAITSLGGMRSIPRLLTLLELQASLMEVAIAREARKEMPIAPDSLYLSWQSLSAGEYMADLGLAPERVH